MPLSPSLLAELDQRLRASRADMMSHVRARLEDTNEPAAISMLAHIAQNDDMPAADMLGDNEMQLLGHELNAVREIDNALARLDAGTAGVCIVCGQQISEQRLLATPTVQTCIACQEQIEKQDRTGRGPTM
jgi:RNA polymerase-binding transcription factor DksA